MGANNIFPAPTLPGPLAPLLTSVLAHHHGGDDSRFQGSKSFGGRERLFSAPGQIALDFPAMSPVLYMGEGFMDDFHGIHEHPG